MYKVPRKHKMTPEQMKRRDALVHWVKNNKTKKQVEADTGINITTLYSWYDSGGKPSPQLTAVLEQHYGQFVGGDTPC